MSPHSAVARPVWVWSLPAVAIFISFLWFRKKRGSLQTDTGGPGESIATPEDDTVQQVKSASETENNNLAVKQECKHEVVSLPTTSVEADLPVVEENITNQQVSVVKEVINFVDKLPKPNSSVVSTKHIIEEECATYANNSNSVNSEPVVEEVLTSVEVQPVLELVSDQTASVVEAKPFVAEVLQSQEQANESSLLEKEPSLKEVLTPELVLEETADTATQIETRHKAEEPKREEVLQNGTLGAKWAKKRRGKKSDDTMSNDAGAEDSKEQKLEQQLAELDLAGDAAQDAVPAGNKTPVTDGGERDSANNSPSEVMLASPSLSGYSDTHSEGSSDSGKGCSDVLTPSPTPVSGNSLSGDLPGDLPLHCVYEFVIPQHLVGRLIGRNGSYIHEIKDNTHASVYIKRHPDTPKLKICAIEGTQVDIENALDMIRHKFPKKRYPNVTLDPVELAPELPPVLPENMQLYLVEGVNNDVILSSLVSAGHFFLQQPTHPTFPSLNRLTSCMNTCYTEPNLPALPDNIQPGVLCAAPVHNGWYRADVTSFPEGDMCEVRFVDFGGYWTIEKSHLRQIRADFVSLPFQAAECFLAAVQPAGCIEEWCEEARDLVETLTLGKVLQAQIHGYTDQSVPLVVLYTVHNNEVVSVNEQLVAHGFAEWLLPEPVTEDATPAAYLQPTSGLLPRPLSA